MASEKITAIVEELKVLTVLELSELVKAVEEEMDLLDQQIQHYKQFATVYGFG